MKRRFDRTERVADLIQKTLATLLIQDVTDQRFSLVTITGVTVSRDLSYAKVYVSVLSDDATQIKEVIQALNRSAKNLRYSMTKEIKLRISPELKFVFDDSTAHGFHISG